MRNQSPKLTSMKLQKLLYYCQAWSLVWNEEPIFFEEILLCPNGPRVEEVYRAQENLFLNGDLDKQPIILDDTQKKTVGCVLKSYGNKTSQWLNDLIQLESPWENAPESPPKIVIEPPFWAISLKVLHEYYGSLRSDENLLTKEGGGDGKANRSGPRLVYGRGELQQFH